MRAKRVVSSLLLLVLLAAIAMAGCGDDDCDLEIDTFALLDGVVGQEYRDDLDADCGGDDWFLDSGTLPPGISLDTDGNLRGVPARAGIFDFTAVVVEYDDFGDEGEVAFGGFSIQVFND